MGTPPRHSGLIGDRHSFSSSKRKQRIAVLGNQCLVGGDDMLAIINRCQYQFPRHACAANQLHQNIHVGIIGNSKDIRGDFQPAGITIGVIAARTDLFNDHRASTARGDLFPIARQDIDGSPPHSAQTAHADTYRAQGPPRNLLASRLCSFFNCCAHKFPPVLTIPTHCDHTPNTLSAVGAINATKTYRISSTLPSEKRKSQ